MHLPDLIAALESLHTQITNDLGEDAADGTVVRLAIQPSYPMQHAIADTGDDIVYVVQDDDQQVIAYLAEAGQVHSAPYLPGEVSAALGWR